MDRASVSDKFFADTMTMGITVAATSQRNAADSPIRGDFHRGYRIMGDIRKNCISFARYHVAGMHAGGLSDTHLRLLM
jgi:hypothetical protein